MPLFKCRKCGCVENTALGYYWPAYSENYETAACSECHTGQWHGQFEKVQADPEIWHPELPNNPNFLRREKYDPEKHGYMPLPPKPAKPIRVPTPMTVHHETRQQRRLAARKAIKGGV